MNTEQEFEEFAKRWPELMQKSQQTDYIGVGKGWHHILDVLFDAMSHKLERAKQRLKYANENPEAKMKETIAELEAMVIAEREALPVIVQIKEKFGGLRFYADGASDEMQNYIDFAEALSNRTCEVCGAPGQRRAGGWIKTLCDRHHRERDNGLDIWGEEDETD